MPVGLDDLPISSENLTQLNELEAIGQPLGTQEYCLLLPTCWVHFQYRLQGPVIAINVPLSNGIHEGRMLNAQETSDISQLLRDQTSPEVGRMCLGLPHIAAPQTE